MTLPLSPRTAATPIGNCPTCGMQMYEGLTHHCGTVYQTPLSTPLLVKDWDLKDAVNRVADALLGIQTERFADGHSESRPVVRRYQPAPCPKCKSEDANIIWHRDNYKADLLHTLLRTDVCGPHDVGRTAGEHLHVYCRVCKFDWSEAIPE